MRSSFCGDSCRGPPWLRASQEQLRDLLGVCSQLNRVFRRLLKMTLEELALLERHMNEFDKEISALLKQHQEAVQRMAEVPGLGVESAQQIIAEIGPTAVFPSEKHLSSWVGVLPRRRTERERIEEHPRAERQPQHAPHSESGCMLGLRLKEGFELVLRRLKGRRSYQETISAIAYRLCRLVWQILHQGIRYKEQGPAVSAKSKRTRTSKMIRELTALGYRIEPINQAVSPA